METPGKILGAERKRLKKSLKHFAKKLKINTFYLKAIEEDNYSFLPADVFTKAYIRLYAGALGLDCDYILSLYKEGQRPDKVQNPATSAPTPPFPVRAVIIYSVLAIVVLSAIILIITREERPVKKFVSTANEQETAEKTKPEMLSLRITAVELTWVSVSIDDGRPKEWLLRAGKTVILKAKKKFALKIGNAGGTRIMFNDVELGALGPHGKVVDIVLP